MNPLTNAFGINHYSTPCHEPPLLPDVEPLNTPSFNYHHLLNPILNGAATFLATGDSKVAALSSLISLYTFSAAQKTDFEADVGDLTFKQTQKTNAIAANFLSSIPITILDPLPDMSVKIGVSLNFPIDLNKYCMLSDSSRNIVLSLQRSDGTPAPEWISVDFGQLSIDASLDLGGLTTTTGISNNFAFVQVGSQVKICNISNPSQPKFVGNLTETSSNIGKYFYVHNNFIYVAHYDTDVGSQLEIYDISNPSNPIFANNITFDLTYNPSGLTFNVFGDGDSLFFASPYGGQLLVVDITNPLNPIYGDFVSSYGNVMAVSDKYCFSDLFPNTQIVDVSNSSNLLIAQIFNNDYTYSMAADNNYLIRGFDLSLQIYDIHQIDAPVLVRTVPLGIAPKALAFAQDYVYVLGWDQWWDFVVKVVDIRDATKSKVVKSLNTFGTASLNGYPGDLSISGNKLFVGENDAGLTIVNAGRRILSGTPTSGDRGLLLLDVTIRDDADNTALDQIAIHVGDINVAMAIPNQQIYPGNSTLFSFDAGTFDYPNANFTYTAKLAGGKELPSFISIDSNSRTFLFTPQSGDQNTYNLEVTANDGYGGTASTTFTLTVPNRPPTVAQPLVDQVAYSGEPFDYIVSNAAFSDPEDILTYSARMVNGSNLPGWLSFDPSTHRFYGTPFGSGTYPIELSVNDSHGGTASDYFTITVPNSAPILLNPIGERFANIGIPFSFTINSDTFFDVDNDVLSYTVDLLPSFLAFNNATRTFNGTPTALDVGSYSIALHAEDPSGQRVSNTFTLTVLGSSNNMPPVLIRAIPDYNARSNEFFCYTFDAGTFEDPENQALTYVAELEGGAPLPTGLYFDSDSRALSGQIDQPQTFRITIRAVDTFGAYALNTFTLFVADSTDYPPIVLNPLLDDTATVGVQFSKEIPANTFKDLNGDPLTIRISQSNGSPLPKWLKWSPETMLLTGKPGPFDTGTYADTKITIDVWATDGVGSVKTSFTLTVQGESFWETFIKYGFSFASVAATGVRLWTARAMIWNHLSKKYKKGEEHVVANQRYERNLSIDESEVQSVRAYRNGFPLHQGKFLPDGLEYRDKKLQGNPSSNSVGRYTIRVTDHDGYINEQYDLLVKKDEASNDF